MTFSASLPWTASQYVDELRRRRDESRRAVQAALDAERAARRQGDRGRSSACRDELLAESERALVYEECAALAELTADERARGPVLDALALLHERARALAVHYAAPPVSSTGPDAVPWASTLAYLANYVGLASAAVDAALDARRALPETVVAVTGSTRCDPRAEAPGPLDEALLRELRDCLGSDWDDHGCPVPTPRAGCP